MALEEGDEVRLADPDLPAQAVNFELLGQNPTPHGPRAYAAVTRNIFDG